MHIAHTTAKIQANTIVSLLKGNRLPPSIITFDQFLFQKANDHLLPSVVQHT